MTQSVKLRATVKIKYVQQIRTTPVSQFLRWYSCFNCHYARRPSLQFCFLYSLQTKKVHKNIKIPDISFALFFLCDLYCMCVRFDYVSLSSLCEPCVIRAAHWKSENENIFPSNIASAAQNGKRRPNKINKMLKIVIITKFQMSLCGRR